MFIPVNFFQSLYLSINAIFKTVILAFSVCVCVCVCVCVRVRVRVFSTTE